MRTRNTDEGAAFAVIATIAFLLGWGSPGWCSPIRDVHRGEQIRIDAPGMVGHVDPIFVTGRGDPFTSAKPHLIGRVRAATADTVFLSGTDSTRSLAVPFEAIRYAQSWRRTSREEGGVMIGFLLGAVTGTVITHRMAPPVTHHQHIGPDFDTVYRDLAGGVAGAFVGGVIGKLVGQRISGMQWVPIDLDALRGGVLLAPAGGVRVLGSISF